MTISHAELEAKRAHFQEMGFSHDHARCVGGRYVVPTRDAHRELVQATDMVSLYRNVASDAPTTFTVYVGGWRVATLKTEAGATTRYHREVELTAQVAGTALTEMAAQ